MNVAGHRSVTVGKLLRVRLWRTAYTTLLRGLAEMRRSFNESAFVLITDCRRQVPDEIWGNVYFLIISI